VSVGESWRLIRQGSPEAFVRALEHDVRGHAALHHPYVERLATGDLPDMRAALWDFGSQYAYYTELFPDYLRGVIDSLKNADHADALRRNLAEETGDPHSQILEERPHRELFQRFLDAIRPEGAGEPDPCQTVLVWRDLFLQKCRSPNAAVGLGGIGLGTESVVTRIYGRLIEALHTHTDLEPDDYVFFTLHARCDDEHADVMRRISVELAQGPEAREALRFGAISALNLRVAFWDVMLGRALDAPEAA
jgi:pyrroloquinoline quinone (PQQ) biosynthesis protein C